MRLIFHIRTVTAALLAALVVSCAEPADEPESALDGDWLVQTIAGAPLAAEERIYFTIDTQAGTLDGFTGCNDFTAAVTVFERSVTISNIIESDLPCPSQAAATNEERLLLVLPSLARFVRTGAALELLALETQSDALLRLRADNFAEPAR